MEFHIVLHRFSGNKIENVFERTERTEINSFAGPNVPIKQHKRNSQNTVKETHFFNDLFCKIEKNLHDVCLILTVLQYISVFLSNLANPCTRCPLQAYRSSERQVCGVGIGWSVECNEEQGSCSFHRQHHR